MVKLLLAPIWFHLPLFDPKIPFLSKFRISYLHLPLFTYIWPYLDFITPISSCLPLIALILPYVPYSPNICILLLRKVFMEILHFKEFGDAESVDTNAVCVFI